MRIISITARNYRIHRDLTVEFDRSRNLIGGPNEVGKSTLAEAMHRALFLRAKTGGSVQKSMVSDIHMGHPEVSLVFEADGQVWTIEKRFAGTTGTARLSEQGGTTLLGDEAETKLAQLIQNADGSGNTLKLLESRWAHLWVWQGKAGDNAVVHAGQQKDQLVKRLQQDGLAAVMQSNFDQQVREKIQLAYRDIFTDTGKPKAGSTLDVAAKGLATAVADLASATDAAQRVAAAVADQNEAAADLAKSTAALPGLREHLATVTALLARVTELRTQKDKETLHYDSACQVREQLAKVDQQIIDLRDKATKAMAALLPAEARISLLADQEKAALELRAQAETTYRLIADDDRLARQQHDLATACVSHFEKIDGCETITNRTTTVAAIQGALAADRDALAKLPSISAEDLETLRKLDGKFRQAESALAAISAGVELISSDQPILLDGSPLAPGGFQVIAEVAELTIGPGTRLRIHPGGGTSLAEARHRVDDSREKLARKLDQLTVRDLEEACGIATKRQVIDQQIATTEAKLQALGADGLPAKLSAAIIARDTAAAEVERRRAAMPQTSGSIQPESIAAARAWHATTRDQLDESVSKERVSRQDVDACRSAHQQAAQIHQAEREIIASARQNFTELKITADTLESNHGDAATRNRELEKALEVEALAKTTLDATLQALVKLNPQALEDDQVRINRSITLEEDKQHGAQTRIAVAQNVLRLDGSHDPEADLLRAKARHATAQDEHAREDRRAKAIALLQKLFSESQAAISAQVTQPIADRISGYLERLLEPGVRAILELTEDGTQMLKLARPGLPAFAFDALSGGAKEQVAAAVRLGMAEILAADHGGCLPLVFDDAFAYADPTRVQALQRMLDLAATRGLQVIVLTCTPSDYIALGAMDIRLSPLALTAVGATNIIVDQDIMENDGDIPSTVPIEVTEEGTAAFLACLRTLGGNAGNQTLRNTLGWDESSYSAVKEALVSQGIIAPGKGRGGSVSLTE